MNKDKKIRIAVDVLLIVLGFVFLGFGIRDAIVKYKSSITPDNALFKKSYPNAYEENIYKYIDVKEANKIIGSGTGIIFIGAPHDSWSQVIVAPLEDAVKELDIDGIYYLEYKDDSDELSIEEELSIPSIIIIKERKVTVVSKEELIDSEYDGIPIEYYDEKHKEDLKNLLRNIL